jgi:SAM-dependent methyltransferase
MAAPTPPEQATMRFADRVGDYVRCRPGYPPEVIACLVERHGLRPEHAVADVGSGTGIWTECLLRHGHRVYAVEPNGPMRAAAERRLGSDARFISIAGTAEATTLPDASVDWVTAAQAFHWFDPPRCRAEFRRILSSPAGLVVLIWNNRREDTPFLAAYEQLLQAHGTDYAAVKHERVEKDGSLERLFGGLDYARYVFANTQEFDYAGLEGRTLSASYTPREGDPRRSALLAELRRVFDEHAQAGRVQVLYETRLYVGSPR